MTINQSRFSRVVVISHSNFFLIDFKKGMIISANYHRPRENRNVRGREILPAITLLFNATIFGIEFANTYCLGCANSTNVRVVLRPVSLFGSAINFQEALVE